MLSGRGKGLTQHIVCLQQDPALQEATASEPLSLQVGRNPPFFHANNANCSMLDM